MKVLLLTPDLPPVLNSAARLFYELGEDLTQAGKEVTVLTRTPKRYLSISKQGRRRFLLREDIGGMRVWRIGAMPLPWHMPLARALEQLWTALMILAIGLRLPRQDAVVVYSPPLPWALVGYILSRLWQGVVIVNVQDLYPQTAVALGLLRQRLLIRLAERLAAFIYRRVDAITVHSEGNRQCLLKAGAPAERVHVVPNWVDLQSLCPGPRLNGWREAHGLGQAFLVSFAGTMGFAQGIEDIIEVADMLSVHKNLVFVLVGDGVFRRILEQEVRERGLANVRFLPPQPPDAYLDLLQASDVCLVTLDKRLNTPVVPGKLQSIMAAGRCVIMYASPHSDGKRIIEEAGCGIFVPAGDKTAFAEAVLTFYRNPHLSEEMGKKGRKYAQQHFDRRLCTGAYAQLLAGLKCRTEVKR